MATTEGDGIYFVNGFDNRVETIPFESKPADLPPPTDNPPITTAEFVNKVRPAVIDAMRHDINESIVRQAQEVDLGMSIALTVSGNERSFIAQIAQDYREAGWIVALEPLSDTKIGLSLTLPAEHRSRYA